MNNGIVIVSAIVSGGGIRHRGIINRWGGGTSFIGNIRTLTEWTDVTAFNPFYEAVYVEDVFALECTDVVSVFDGEDAYCACFSVFVVIGVVGVDGVVVNGSSSGGSCL